MSKFTDYAGNKVADYFRGQGITLPANWYVALGTSAPGGSFTELTGAGYARVAVVRSLAAWAGTQGAGTTAASSGRTHRTSNNAAISFGMAGGAWGTATKVALFDASSGGNCWVQQALGSPIVIDSGTAVSIAAGAMAFSVGITGGMSDYLSNKLVDLLWRGQAYSWPATLYLAAFTTSPTNAGGGTEVNAASYARPLLVPSLTSLCGTQGPGTTAASSGTGGRIANNATIGYPAPGTSDWGTVTHEGIKDASTAGNVLFWGAIMAPKTVSPGGAALIHDPDTLELTIA